VQVLETIMDLSKHKNFFKVALWSQMVYAFWCVNGFQDFATTFLDEVLF
jgi:hypothetical protein